MYFYHTFIREGFFLGSASKSKASFSHGSADPHGAHQKMICFIVILPNIDGCVLKTDGHSWNWVLRQSDSAAGCIFPWLKRDGFLPQESLEFT